MLLGWSLHQKWSSAKAVPSFEPTAGRVLSLMMSSQLLPYLPQFAQHTTEWAIPYEHTKECLLHLREWLEQEPYSHNGTYPNFPIELRFSAPDDIWLSPAYGRRTCWIGIMQFK
jgi:hypothetical protein